MELVFRTVHGSHLYGLATENSDLDTYEVYDVPGTSLRQFFRETGEDVVQGGIWAFIERAKTGSHQSCEALFSTKKEWTDYGYAKYGAMVENLVVTGGEVFQKYERTIRKFSYGDFKRRRHAVRLYFHLHELRKHGRFNPTMNGIQITLANKLAELYSGDDLAERLEIAKEN